MTPLFDLYIACCTEDGGVWHVVLYDDGTLEQAETVSLPSPLYVVLQQNTVHTLLYNPFKTGESGYTVLPLDNDGTLGKNGEITATGGGEACFFSVTDEGVYIANYQTGSVAKLSPNGDCFVRSHERGGAIPHPHFIAPTPNGEWLLCTDLGQDTVITYDRALNPMFTAKTPAGSGPRHLAFSPDGKTVYCVNELGNTVTVFSYENGRLVPLETVEALPGYSGESYAAALRLYDGKLYVSHRGANCLTVLNAANERLAFEERIPCGGNWPRDFDIFGEFLVCTNEKSDSVTVLRKNGGEWTVCSSLSLPRPLCVVGKEWSRGV